MQTVEQVQREVAGADVFLRRSSFGRTTLRADVTPVIAGFVVPQRCPADADHGLGALSEAARAAAASLGYDLGAYDRFLYLFPGPVCDLINGIGVGREVVIAHLTGGSSLGLVHELGHTFGLPHASNAVRHLMRIAGGTLWIERRQTPVPRILIRVVKRPPGGGTTRSISLAIGRNSATVPGLVSTRTIPGGKLVVTRFGR